MSSSTREAPGQSNTSAKPRADIGNPVVRGKSEKRKQEEAKRAAETLNTPKGTTKLVANETPPAKVGTHVGSGGGASSGKKSGEKAMQGAKFVTPSEMAVKSEAYRESERRRQELLRNAQEASEQRSRPGLDPEDLYIDEEEDEVEEEDVDLRKGPEEIEGMSYTAEFDSYSKSSIGLKGRTPKITNSGVERFTKRIEEVDKLLAEHDSASKVPMVEESSNLKVSVGKEKDEYETEIFEDYQESEA